MVITHVIASFMLDGTLTGGSNNKNKYHGEKNNKLTREINTTYRHGNSTKSSQFFGQPQ